MTDLRSKCGADAQGGQPIPLQSAALRRAYREKHNARHYNDFDCDRDRIDQFKLNFVKALRL